MDYRLEYKSYGADGELLTTTTTAAAASAVAGCTKVQAVRPPLPALAGTPKQVTWAEDIRAKALRDYDMVVAAAEAEAKRPNATATSIEAASAALAALDSITDETSARWWIDHRAEGLLGLVRRDARVAAAIVTSR